MYQLFNLFYTSILISRNILLNSIYIISSILYFSISDILPTTIGKHLCNAQEQVLQQSSSNK